MKVMLRTATSPGIRFFRMLLLSVGLITLVFFGGYATDQRLVEWAVLYVKSGPGTLAAETVTLLQRLRIGIIIGGIALAAASVALGYLEPLLLRVKESAVRHVNLAAVVTAGVDWIGNWLSRVFVFTIKDRVLWSLLFVMLFTIPVAGFFLSPAGGLHVEGIDLQPAKNLVRHGIYGTLTTHGFDELTYKSSAGPAIVLPSALAFWLFGVNVYYSRAIELGFLIATVLTFYRLSYRLFEKETAWLGTFMVAPLMMFFTGGDTGMGSEGYVPGFFYFMAGSLFWFRAVDRGRNRDLMIAGLFWGLAFQTKWLYLFALPSLIITWIILRPSRRPLGHRYYFLPILGVILLTAVWVGFRIWDIGARQELVHLHHFWGQHGNRAVGLASQQGLVNSIFSALRPIATLSQVDLWGEFQIFLIAPAVLYVVFIVLRDKMADYRTLFILIFGFVWFSWWLLFNLDLYRQHLYPVLFIGQLFIAKMFYDIWKITNDHRKRFLDLIRGDASMAETWAYLARVGIVCIVLLEVIPPLALRVNVILYRYNLLTKPYLEMETYIRANTEKNAVFSGWLYSLPFYLDLDPAGDHITKDRTEYPLDQRESVPEYFIVSPDIPLETSIWNDFPAAVVDNAWSRKQNEIRKEFIVNNCVLIKTFGDSQTYWALYKVKNDRIESGPLVGSTGS